MTAEAHESNCQKKPKMATCESPNGQNYPRNINWKYTDQELPNMAKNFEKIPKMANNSNFCVQIGRNDFKRNSS